MILIELLVKISPNKVLSEVSVVARKSLHTLRSKSISDHWKEKAVLMYARSMFISTIKLAGIFFSIGIVAVLLVILFDEIHGGLIEIMLSWTGIVYTVVVTTVYILIRKCFV
jgi:hypothetical protein